MALQSTANVAALLVHGITKVRGTIGRDYSSHTSPESLKSLDFKSN